MKSKRKPSIPPPEPGDRVRLFVDVIEKNDKLLMYTIGYGTCQGMFIHGDVTSTEELDLNKALLEMFASMASGGPSNPNNVDMRILTDSGHYVWGSDLYAVDKAELFDADLAEALAEGLPIELIEVPIQDHLDSVGKSQEFKEALQKVNSIVDPTDLN